MVTRRSFQKVSDLIMRFHKLTLTVKSLHLSGLQSLQKSDRVSIVDGIEVLCLMSPQLGSAATRVSQSGAQEGQSHFPPKFEHIFVAVITFFPLSSVQILLLPVLLIVFALR